MALISGWINRLTEHAREEIGHTIRGLVLYGLAGLAGLAAVVFVTLAVYWALADYFESAGYAALVMALIYLIVASILAAWAMALTSPQQQEVNNPEATTALHATAAPDSVQAEASKAMGIDLEDIASTLATAGYRVESLAVMAASDVARQLSPLQFISLVFVGTFFFGRRLRQ